MDRGHDRNVDDVSEIDPAAAADDARHVLIVVASKHGATTGIAGALAQRLGSHGLRVNVAPPDDASDLAEVDAVVIGSAVYYGKWIKAAARFVEDHTDELARLPVWLFSSGPLGDDEHGTGMDADHMAHLTDTAHARAHHVFPGCLDKGALGPLETLMAVLVHAPVGDYRDWTEIHDWADEIAAELAT